MRGTFNSYGAEAAGGSRGVLMSFLGKTLGALPLAQGLGLRLQPLKSQPFPDGQPRLQSEEADFRGQTVWVLDSLSHLQTEAFELLFLGRWLKEQGACRVHWVAPYLAGMRESIGQAWQPRWWLQLVAESFDALWTVWPHVARTAPLVVPPRLSFYPLCPAQVLVDWVRAQALRVDWVLGPDEGARSLCAAVAQGLGRPYACLKKTRLPDGRVILDEEQPLLPPGAQVLLVDDLICTGRTIAAALGYLGQKGQVPVGVMAVHGVWTPAFEQFQACFPQLPLWTTQTLSHPKAQIQLFPWLLNALKADVRAQEAPGSLT